MCFIHLLVVCDFPRVKGCCAEAEVAIAACCLPALRGLSLVSLGECLAAKHMNFLSVSSPRHMGPDSHLLTLPLIALCPACTGSILALKVSSSAT